MILHIFKNKLVIVFTSVLAVMILFNIIFFGYVSKQLDSVKQESEQIEQELALSQAIPSSISQLQEQEEQVKNQYIAVCDMYPKELTQENALRALKNLSDEAGININNITFDMVEPVEKHNATKMTVKFSFKGSYNRIAQFIYLLNNNEQRISLRQLAFNGFHTDLTGNAVISFHGYNNSISELAASTESLLGKYDLFEIFSGGEPFVPQRISTDGNASTEKVGRQSYDFYMIMNKATDDAPNIIVGKNKQSEIYADGNKTNWVNIQISEKDGKLAYRYRTESYVYPNEVGSQEFTPIGKGAININIFSEAIGSVNDKSRVMLNVFNDTSRKVLINVTGTDGKARVIKNIFNGDVELRYE